MQASPNDRFGIIGDYIVDFLFRRSRLIVEIDGGYHFTDEQQLYDTIRQEWLENQGFKVIRFTNQEVLFNPDYVITKIKQNL
ncbi:MULTISPECIES: endonuclease domain-containing protein [Prevotella]|uniref:endonuclease domain-containing protein n=1 Tax=Prevotella TaxID=838 RepID=UPI0009E2E9AD